MDNLTTPGPWEAQYTIIIGPDSEVIADTSCPGGRQAPRATQKANARLIAAAPMLLKELEKAARCLNAAANLMANGEDALVTREIAQEIRAAIAQVKGETK